MSCCRKQSGAASGDDKPEDFYIIKEQLGSGAFSVVKRAVDRKTNQEVALKLIPTVVYNQNKEATLREVAILQKMNHPNIVHLYRALDGKRYFVIALELLRGKELFESICELVEKYDRTYSEQDAIRLTSQLLEAIAYLHDNKIAHRDLKPDNAVFADTSETAQLKLTDFGFANEYDANNPFVRACGTPLYVAPEILQDHPNGYDYQCDMWSLGVIVYILLCGFPPFMGDTDTELYRNILDVNYSFMPPYWDNISDEAKDFIERCFKINPKERMTARQALAHSWICSGKSKIPLDGAVYELRKTQAKRKLIKGVFAVIAMNRMRRATSTMSKQKPPGK